MGLSDVRLQHEARVVGDVAVLSGSGHEPFEGGAEAFLAEGAALDGSLVAADVHIGYGARVAGYVRYNGLGLDPSLGAMCGCMAPPNVNHSLGAATEDGPGGVDNAFAHGAIYIWMIGEPSAESHQNEAIAAGAINLAFRLEGLRPAEPTSYTVGAEAIVTSPLGSAPAFDGADVFPYDPNEPAAAFERAYMTGDVAVLEGGRLPLPLVVFGARIVLHVERAAVTLELDASREHVVAGVLGGILDADELARMPYLTLSASAWSCDNVGVADELRGVADIMRDGSQTPGVLCDGVSIGVGFRSVRAELGDAVEPPPLPPPCPGAP